MRASLEHFQSDYYQKLLSNYNPSRNLTPAAKQIELDLLRTLPNNKHYDGPHADGIAKLRRVLLAYSVHNPEVEYCQVHNMRTQYFAQSGTILVATNQYTDHGVPLVRGRSWIFEESFQEIEFY